MLDIIEVRNVFVKYIVKRMKRHATEKWENIFAKHISDKKLSKTYKEFLNHNNKKAKQGGRLTELVGA